MPTPFRRAKRRLLNAVHLPVNLYLAYIAVATALSGGQGAVGVLPWWLAWAWGAALVFGGALVLWGTVSENTRRESAGHGFQIAGVLIYAVVDVVEGSSSDPVALAVLIAVPLLRMRMLKQARRAHQEAQRLVEGGLS